MASEQVDDGLALGLEDAGLWLRRAFDHSSLLEVVGGLATHLVAVDVAIGSWRLLALPSQRSTRGPRSDPVLGGDRPDDACRRLDPGWMLRSVCPDLVLAACSRDVVSLLLLLVFLGSAEHETFDSVPSDC